MQNTKSLSFDIKRKSEPELTFKVKSVIDKFDLQQDFSEQHFVGTIERPERWSIGLIVGRSGTGKTTIAKELFPDSHLFNYEYGAKAIVDEMPEGLQVSDITKAFNTVGFSSPPNWLKPYGVLSNGEKMRVDIARALLEKNELIVFDEFTSVVDRHIAKIASFAISKAVRKSDKQFIAVSCHDDIIEWLEPDWVFDTNQMKMIDCKKKDQKLSSTSMDAAINYGIHLNSITI